MYSREEKLKLIEGLMWDYHYSPEECLEVLEGQKSQVGHYNEYSLFRKLLESFRWFTVLKLVPLERIRELLTKEVIDSLRISSMKKKYEFIRERLQDPV